MIVPAVGNRSLRLSHLMNTVTSSATFRRLVGAANAAAAESSVHYEIALDEGANLAAFPRAILWHQGPQMIDARGVDNFVMQGQLSLFIQFERPTAAELLTWYSLSSGTPIENDYRLHANNIFGAITDELLPVCRTATFIEFQRLEEYGCDTIDPRAEGGRELFELIHIFHLEGGLP